MRSVNFVPLALALACLLPIVLSRYHARVDRFLTRFAVRTFGSYIDEFRGEHPTRQSALRAAQFPTTYREYGSKTMLYAAILAVVGSIAGIYAIWAVLLVLAVDAETMREALPGALEFLANLGGVPALSPGELFVLIALACFTVGAVAASGTYWLRWWYPRYVADARSQRIERALPATVSFIYALSRSGMAFPTVIRIVARHEETYGEAAAEFEVAVRHMDTFGTDVVTALQIMGRRSPSPQFGEFTENLVSVLQSGHSLSEFLERQYRDYQEESETQQERTLELLSTLAEAYVTVLVAGPLFLITILVVIGIAVGDTLDPLQALIYGILPLGNLAFVIYLSVVTDSIVPGSETAELPSRSTAFPSDIERRANADGGVADASTGSTAGEADLSVTAAANIERVGYYRRLRAVRDRFGDPKSALLERPSRTLFLTVPIAVAAVLWQLPAAFAGGGFTPSAIDDVVAAALLVVLVPFAVVYELHRRRIRAIEAAVPDLLDRLASVNEAGLSIVSAIDQVRESELGPLGAELDLVWRDVQWGADLETALRRFDRRIRTRSVSRVVTLLTEAMNASGDLATVLRIAARQSASDRRLERERAQTMVEYMIVVYVSFLVFLFIITVLAAYLLPNLPTEGAEVARGGGDAGTFSGLSAGEADAYGTLFYHAALVQGLLSGLIAGQLSTGELRAGAKHAAIMIALTIGLFALVV
ncbi:type II secretion system F family protein [Natrarchaeobius chitinivorans]|uniref:Type II secretion protein F n=1 Tax=Natrarchaeobius chitinivorans TaxID=1679083 RepID=A0A3N6M8K3_NATCH|nr:type II secretion system F family protein [Natrarchaeobius chitinivorans]RQG92550.1 type II secretion protein F [Natrarchaeobius chitinivorans]